MIRYLDKVIKPLVLILPKMSGYVRRFKVKDGDKDKNYKIMSFRIDNENLLEKYKTIWTKIEDLKNNDMNALLVYDNRYIKTKLRTYGSNIYTNFGGLNVLEGDIKSESFTVISTDFLLVYGNECYFQIYLDNYTYKTVGKWMIYYLGETLFKTDENWLLINGFYKCCIRIELI